MGERWLLVVFARARGSKGGAVLTVIGVFLLFVTLVIGLVSVAGDALLVMTGVGPVVRFLETGPGVGVGFLVSVFVILLGVAFLTHATPQPTQSVSVVQQAGTPQAEKDREIDRLRKRLRTAEQERDRYHAILSDPTAKKQRDEAQLRNQCLELAKEVRFFAGGRGLYVDVNEVVHRFQIRHEDKVTDLRNKLEQRGWLTPQEWENLTLHDADGIEKIKAMADTLGSIGVGR